MELNENFLKRHLAQTTPYPLDIKIERAEGIYLYDEKGNRYADLISGIGVSSLGHNNKRISQAISAQVEKHSHVMVFGEFEQESQMNLASELCSFLPESLDTCYFLNSGTEAVEAALKLAKRVTGRMKIMSFKGAYHGSTFGSLSVSGNENKKYAFRPLLPGVEFMELNNLKDLERLDDSYSCVILETIQGDAGVRIPNLKFIQELYTLCKSNGILLILDEIQVGMGRTGKFSAFEHFDIVPDILILGKSLGAGLPIGAVVSSMDLMKQFIYEPVLGHITTFGGHPVICAAAYAGLLEIREEKLIEGVSQKGDLIYELLKGHPKIKEIRYKGLFFAVELENAGQVNTLVMKGLEKGLLLFWFLSTPNAFRMAPPLIITEDEIRLNIDILKQLLDEL